MFYEFVHSSYPLKLDGKKHIQICFHYLLNVPRSIVISLFHPWYCYFMLSFLKFDLNSKLSILLIFSRNQLWLCWFLLLFSNYFYTILWWILKSLMLSLSSFLMQACNAIHFPLNIALAASHKFCRSYFHY